MVKKRRVWGMAERILWRRSRKERPRSATCARRSRAPLAPDVVIVLFFVLRDGEEFRGVSPCSTLSRRGRAGNNKKLLKEEEGGGGCIVVARGFPVDRGGEGKSSQGILVSNGNNNEYAVEDEQDASRGVGGGGGGNKQ